SPQQDRLALACTNGLAGANPIRKGPFVVAASPDLQASTASGTQPANLNFLRKVDKTPASALAPLPADPLRASDAAPPAHRKPIKYRVEAPQLRPGTVDVIV